MQPPPNKNKTTANVEVMLSDNPDWHGAAKSLVHSFVCLPSLDDRIKVMDKLCQRLDSGLYPVFLQILFTVEQHGTFEAKELVAETFFYSLVSGRLPEGSIPAWGANQTVADSAFGLTRRLGPIEYCCAWYSQPGMLEPLSRGVFTSVVSSLIRLFSVNENMRKLYCEKLIADAEDPIGGSLSRQTRDGLTKLASLWSARSITNTQDKSELESMSVSLVETFLDALRDSVSLQAITSNPFS